MSEKLEKDYIKLNVMFMSIQKENKRLKEVLEFYADRSQYYTFAKHDGDMKMIELDSGKKARRALKKSEQ